METVFLQRVTSDVPWGFRLYGGCDSVPLTVQKVTAGSVASENVEAGDVIARIGDEDATTMNHEQAMQAIRSSGNSLQLGLLRSSNRVPSSPPQPDPIPAPQFNHQLSLDNPHNGHDNWSHDKWSHDNWSHDNNNIDLSFQPQEPKIPDAILNMAARGEGSKKPFAYVADINDIQMQREKVKNRSPGQQVIPRYQNLLNMPQFDDSPRIRNMNRSAVPTSPPVQTGGDAVISNLQFNTPLQMYSSDNVLESLKGQTGAEIKDVFGLPKKERSDITQSAVYKMIHGIDQPKAKPVISYAESRPTVNDETQEEENVGDYPQKSIRYTGTNIPSRSFRMLQSMTSGDNTPVTQAVRQQPMRRPPQMSQPTRNFRPQEMPQQYSGYSTPTYGRQYSMPRGGSMERREGSSEVDTTSIYQHLRGTPGADDYNEKSVRYVGKSIPSKCFRLLQDMTGGPRENDSSPSVPKRHPMQQRHMASPQTQSDVEFSDGARPGNMIFTGNNIPSHSFKMLQRSIGDNECSPGPPRSVSMHRQVSTEESTDF